MIEQLGYFGRRIFEAELHPNGRELILTEACDEYYHTALVREEVEELAQDLLNLAAQMAPSRDLQAKP